MAGNDLTHFGVPGMKWGHRKAVMTSRRNAAADYKTSRKLARASRPGIRKERAAIKKQIDERMQNDPEYAKKFKRIPTDRKHAAQIVTAVAVGALVVESYHPFIMKAVYAGNRNLVNNTNKGADWMAKKIREAKATAPTNPKKSPYWNDMVIKGSGEWAGTAMELYRGL